MLKVLETNKLCKQYGEFKAVNRVDMSIREGEIYGLIGKNGAGKTTFMKIISGLVEPSSGDFILFECDNYKKNLGEIGCVIETPALYENMTAKQNYQMVSILSRNKEQFEFGELMNIVGLDVHNSKKVKQYSLGMKQRLGIAIALVSKPKFLILDEPINGLDPVGIKEFRNMLIRLNKNYGVTILISSHILSELFKLVDCYGIMQSGKLVKELREKDFENNRLFTEEKKEQYILNVLERCDYDSVNTV